MSSSTFYGFSGRILFIDLASRAVRTELFSEEEMRTYGGGSLLSAVLLLRNTRPGLDPMTGDGALIFASSVVASLPFVGLARFSVCGKSPLTGGFGEARCEGPFAAGIKKSGYDAIVFEGRAPERRRQGDARDIPFHFLGKEYDRDRSRRPAVRRCVPPGRRTQPGLGSDRHGLDRRTIRRRHAKLHSATHRRGGIQVG